MKVLYVGVYRDGTGYSEAAINYILALDSVGIDVVCRPLKLNNHQPELPKRILELEQKNPSGADYNIQHCLPHQMFYSGKFKKNIALYATETSSFKDSSWPDRLNLMDQIWVINNQMVNAALNSGVTKQINVVPHCFDMGQFEQSYPILPLKESNDEFLFYFIGEFNRRKNIAGILKAFHTEFDPSERTRLILKTHIPGSDRNPKIIEDGLSEIKLGLKLHGGNLNQYKKEQIITQRMSNYEIMRLHASCDCGIFPSYGEAWSIPTFISMGMGKTPICSNSTGFLDYMNNNCGWMIPTREEPVFGMVEGFKDLYTGNENWFSPDILTLRKYMREAYTQDSTCKEKAKAGRQRAYDFSYERVGNLMKGLLESYEKEEQ